MTKTRMPVLILFVALTMLLFQFVHERSIVNHLGEDGPLTIGWPLRYYDMTAGYGGVGEDRNLLCLAVDLLVCSIPALLVSLAMKRIVTDRPKMFWATSILVAVSLVAIVDPFACQEDVLYTCDFCSWPVPLFSQINRVGQFSRFAKDKSSVRLSMYGWPWPNFIIGRNEERIIVIAEIDVLRLILDVGVYGVPALLIAHCLLSRQHADECATTNEEGA